MLAYTAVDGLRAISRDFDLDWQPALNDDFPVTRRHWRSGVRSGQRVGQQPLGAFLALLPFAAIAWQR